MQVDANKVIENLSNQVGQYARDIAVLQTQVEVLKAELNKEKEANTAE